MVTNVKEAFANRLNEALDTINAPRKGKGRQKFVQELMRRQNVTITENGARKWLEGESIPGMDNLTSLASALGTSLEWLGTGRANAVKETKASYNTSPLDQRYHALPAFLRPAVLAVLEAQERAADGLKHEIDQEDIAGIEAFLERTHPHLQRRVTDKKTGTK